MAPATIAGATRNRTSESRPGGWDRDAIIEAIQEWVACFGEPPRAADWNPSAAKWTGQQWRVERYRAGRADGSPWPALNSAKRPFGGSLNAAVQAAGFAPAKPGPRRRTSVDPAQADRAVISPEGRAMLQAALAQAREAEQRIAVLEARLQRAITKEDTKSKTTIKTKVIRERVVDDAAVARAQRRAAAVEAKAAVAVADAQERVGAARTEVAEARHMAKRLAARLERAEATVGALRDERRELQAAAQRSADRLVAAERRLATAPTVVHVHEEAPEAAALRAAELAARDAEVRAARAERELRETVAAVRGEARALTSTELAELRARGPSGPAVLAASLKALARARAGGGTTTLQAALLQVAAAAITWRERI